MRAAFVAALHRLADQDDRVMLLTGDLGFMVVEDFARAHPFRFLNVGVAEANMIGVATGLAAQGWLPFCYSIATFATMRGYEQIRNGPVLHGLPVRIVGVGGGFAYGSAGRTHHALEDIGLARLQPGLGIIAPADDAQAAAALEATYDLHFPIYYRVAKDRLSIPALGGRFRLGRIETLGSGTDLLILVAGGMTAIAVQAAAHLEREGIMSTVAVMACVAPIPVQDLRQLLPRFPLAATVEDHYLTGGIGSLVAEVAADEGLPCRLVRCAALVSGDGRSGSEPYLRAQAGLATDQLVARVRAAVAARRAA